MTEDTLIPRPRYWRKERRRMRRATMEIVSAYFWHGGRSLSWCADVCGISKSHAHRLAHRLGRAGSLDAARRFGLIPVDLSGVAATELVQVVDLEDVGSTGASMSPVLSALELS